MGRQLTLLGRSSSFLPFTVGRRFCFCLVVSASVSALALSGVCVVQWSARIAVDFISRSCGYFCDSAFLIRRLLGSQACPLTPQSVRHSVALSGLWVARGAGQPEAKAALCESPGCCSPLEWRLLSSLSPSRASR